MKTTILRGLVIAGAMLACAPFAHSQIIQFNATLNASQEVPATSSSAAGSAVLLYDVGANNFDLIVTLSNFSNTLSAVRIQEAVAGATGAVVSNLGTEAVFTRNGNTLTATLHGLSYGGTKLTLLQNGAYLNFVSAAFPNGEVRGQLVAQPKRLTANMTVTQEQAAFPTVALNGIANAFGSSVMTYNSGTNTVNLHISIYNYTNTLTLSHYHEGAPGVSGPVVTSLGAQTVANYARTGNWITGTFLNLPYTGDPIKLLTGGAYVNFHSNIFPAGECRGQVTASDEVLATHVANTAARGPVGVGDQVLIGGIVVTGSEPVRMLITAKGPSLAAFGLTGVLTNPQLTLYDSLGRTMAVNDDVGAVTASSELATLPGVPQNPLESALLVILPPGNYTAVVSGNGGTGIALLEATDLRNVTTLGTGVAGVRSEYDRDLKLAARNPRFKAATSPNKSALELCVGLPLAVATPRR